MKRIREIAGLLFTLIPGMAATHVLLEASSLPKLQFAAIALGVLVTFVVFTGYVSSKIPK